MRRTILLIAISTCAVLAPAVASHAAPPARGAAPPQRVVPTQIDADYVGPARIGPQGYCGPQSNDPTAGVTLCVDVTLRRCQRWTKRVGVWHRDGFLANFSSEVFWVAPYGEGYHWIWNFNGYHAVATSCLNRYEPTFG